MYETTGESNSLFPISIIIIKKPYLFENVIEIIF